MDIPRHWWASVVLLLILLLSAEICARFLLAPVGDNLWAYDSASLSRSFEWYRQQTQNGTTPRIVAIGDSTGARNFDPASFSEVVAIDDVYSLARAGNFPRAMRSNTLPLLDTESVPEIVILMQWPGSLRDDPRTDQIEAGMVSSILEARIDDRFIITDYIQITRLFRARSYLLDFWIRDEPLVRRAENNGFDPFVRRGDDGNAGLGVSVLSPEEFTFSEARRDVTRALLNIATRRNFVVIAVVGPFFSGTDFAIGNEHLYWLKGLERQHCANLVVLDLRSIPELASESFKDNHHLFEDGARMFTRALGIKIRDLRERDLSTRDACSM
jgi:hypothetical protein